jgi:hypothetical protein
MSSFILNVPTYGSAHWCARAMSWQYYVEALPLMRFHRKKILTKSSTKFQIRQEESTTYWILPKMTTPNLQSGLKARDSISWWTSDKVKSIYWRPHLLSSLWSAQVNDERYRIQPWKFSTWEKMEGRFSIPEYRRWDSSWSCSAHLFNISSVQIRNEVQKITDASFRHTKLFSWALQHVANGFVANPMGQMSSFKGGMVREAIHRERGFAF